MRLAPPEREDGHLPNDGRGVFMGMADHQVDGGLFVMNYLYFVSPELIRFYGKPLSVDVQWEFGVTFGTMTPWKVLGLAIPRIGMSYRVGSGASTFRLVLGGPFL